MLFAATTFIGRKKYQEVPISLPIVKLRIEKCSSRLNVLNNKIDQPVIGHCRYEKRHSNILAHISSCFHVKQGDYVIIGQCK